MENESNFLADNVFPHLDAVESGFLDSWSPKRSGSAYSLTCPECNHRGRAFYYPGGQIRCNRRNECGAVVSVFDVMLRQHGSRREVFELLCQAVGVEPPRSDSKDQRPTIYAAFKRITKGHFSGEVRTRFAKWRGYTETDLSQMELGYFPSSAQLTKELINLGFKKRDIYESGLIAKPDEWDGFAGRVIGFWRQPNGTFSLWGRRFNDEATNTPKYLFVSGMSKAIPYLFRRSSDVMLIEGPLDCYALRLLSYNASAIGGSHVTRAQAQYLAGHGVTSFHYISDGDEASYEGVIKTIFNARLCGISSTVTILPKNSDDADAMRSKGLINELQALISKPLTDGACLGHLYAYYKNSSNAQDISKLNQIRKLRTLLSADGRRDFDLTLVGHGYELNFDAEALSDLAQLVSFMPLEKANEFIAKRYGVKVEFVNEGTL